MKQKNVGNIIPESRPEPSVFFEVLFWIFLGLLVILVGFYFKFAFQKSQLKSQLSKVEAEIELQSKTQLKEELTQDSKRLDKFVELFQKQNIYSNLFDFLEKNTLSRVYFSSLRVDSKEMSVSLVGDAGSFKKLSQQILVLKNKEKINNLKVSDLSLKREGSVGFSLDFSFSKDLIKR